MKKGMKRRKAKGIKSGFRKNRESRERDTRRGEWDNRMGEGDTEEMERGGKVKEKRRERMVG